MSKPRGTTNGNARGSSYTRRARRAWVMTTWASDQPGFVRCYRCGVCLYNPDDELPEPWQLFMVVEGKAHPLTIDRIVPGCQGGTYRRNNIRPACPACNSETGGATRGRKKP